MRWVGHFICSVNNHQSFFDLGLLAYSYLTEAYLRGKPAATVVEGRNHFGPSLTSPQTKTLWHII